MQSEENRNSYPRKTWRGVYVDKLHVILSLLMHISSRYVSPPFFLSTIKLLSLSHLVPQSFNTLFSCLPFLPVATSLTDVSGAALCIDATNQAAHSSRVICVTDSWKCALVSSPLSPLTATSPLCHRQTDQIGTGPSHTVVDKWKVAVGSGFIGLVRVDQAEMKWKNVPSWSWGLFTINPEGTARRPFKLQIQNPIFSMQLPRLEVERVIGYVCCFQCSRNQASVHKDIRSCVSNLQLFCAFRWENRNGFCITINSSCGT